jgi:colanic acid/amylovoran biosynthesis protein
MKKVLMLNASPREESNTMQVLEECARTIEKSEYAKRIFKTHLLNVDLITSREPETTKYLENLGIVDNVKECADPAFVVSSGKKVQQQHNDHLVIGLNLSPLSLNQIFNDETKEKILLKQAKIIEDLISTFHAEIILIPHVVSQSVNDDDLSFLKQLIIRVNDKFRDNVSIVDDDPGFIGIKNILIKCDALITARMHCAINALEAGVPTIFISYSKKSEGMASYVYGNKKWVIPLKNFESANILPLLDTLLTEKEDIGSFLVNKMQDIKLDAFKPLKTLNDMF